jgi:hypothetical protein
MSSPYVALNPEAKILGFKVCAVRPRDCGRRPSLFMPRIFWGTTWSPAEASSKEKPFCIHSKMILKFAW